MANDKYIKLVRRLSETTHNGNLEWEATGDQEVFQAALPNYGVRIWRQAMSDDSTDIVLAVVNSDGAVIDEVRDTMFTPASFDGKKPYEYMNEMFLAAKRRALGVEQALDSILKDLDDLDDIPF